MYTVSQDVYKRQDNIENIQFAVNTYLGGQDNMAKDLWWAKNN